MSNKIRGVIYDFWVSNFTITATFIKGFKILGLFRDHHQKAFNGKQEQRLPIAAEI